MPVRATKRGAERTRFASDAAADIVICGASFAGLAVARELRASGARVLVLDRYEIGERQTSACAAPTDWLLNLGLSDSIRQTFSSLLVHTPKRTARWPLPWTFSTFDYRTLCRLLWEQSGDATFETAKVDGRTGHDRALRSHRPRGRARGADRRRPRLAARARRRRERAAAGRPAVTRAGGAPARPRRRPRAVARPPLRRRPATAGRSPPATSCGSASARSTRACT